MIRNKENRIDNVSFNPGWWRLQRLQSLEGHSFREFPFTMPHLKVSVDTGFFRWPGTNHNVLF